MYLVYPSFHLVMISFESATNIPKNISEKISLPDISYVATPETARSRIIIDCKAKHGIVNKYLIQSIIDSYRAYDTSNTIYIFLVTDTCETYNIPPHVRVYRTSLLASKKHPNEYVLPYIWEGISPAFLPLPRTEKPTIGFCGLVSPYRVKTLMEFQQDSRFTTNYIIRQEFWGGSPHHPTIVSDFEANMKATHFNICNRGAGNFSMRFYQTLSAGRIPILLNTDMELPFMNEIDWKKYIVFADTEKDLAEKTWIFWNTRNISDAQTKCKEIYETYFAGTRYLDRLFAEAISEKTKSAV